MPTCNGQLLAAQMGGKSACLVIGSGDGEPRGNHGPNALMSEVQATDQAIHALSPAICVAMVTSQSVKLISASYTPPGQVPAKSPLVGRSFLGLHGIPPTNIIDQSESGACHLRLSILPRSGDVGAPQIEPVDVYRTNRTPRCLVRLPIFFAFLTTTCV